MASALVAPNVAFVAVTVPVASDGETVAVKVILSPEAIEIDDAVNDIVLVVVPADMSVESVESPQPVITKPITSNMMMIICINRYLFAPQSLVVPPEMAGKNAAALRCT
jgi:hypothetical protein